MGWDQSFLDALQANRLQPRYIIKSLSGAGFDTAGVHQLFLSSHDEGPYYHRVIARSGHRIATGAVRPGEWSTSIGEATIMLTGAYDPRPGMARGMLVQVRMGFPGMGPASYEPIFTGVVTNLARTSSGEWALVIRSVLSALLARSTQTASQTRLFSTADDVSGVTAADYVATDGSIEVDDASTLESETGGKFLLQVTPDSGDPFLVTCSAVNTGTGECTVSTAGILGTTDADAALGNEWRGMALVEDHPVDVARKVMLSGGNGGTYDTLPDTWGVALHDDVVDHDDCDLTIALDSTTSALNWLVTVDTPQDDGFTWLQSVLTPAGYFLCERQGRISVRMAIASGSPVPEIATITDRDIVSIDRWDTWDPSQPVEYGRMRTRTADGSSATTTETLTSIPAKWSFKSELPFIDTNESTWMTAIRTRMGPWAMRLAEVVELTTVGWRFAHLAPGSGVQLVTRHVIGRVNDFTTWMVVHCEPDWFGASVRLVLTRVSEQAGDP
jgi:hypothetical protein